MSSTVGRMLDEAWAALDLGNIMKARSLARRAHASSEYRSEALHIMGRAALDEEHFADAVNLLQRSAKEGSNNPDLYYDLGIAHEYLGNHRESTEAFLKVHRLDGFEALEPPFCLDEDRLVAVAEETVLSLPRIMIEKLRNAPILVEERPDSSLVNEGFDPRALGLFEGPPYSEQGLTGPALNRIVLYRANIAAASRSLEDADEQVRITLLHETAHFFGLDESEVSNLGLA